MNKALLALAVIGLVLSDGSVSAKEKSVAGTWTLTIEQRFGLKLVLEQKRSAVTGTLSWSHGDPIKLRGELKGDKLALSGDGNGEKENFTVHVESTGTVKADGTMSGTLKALFVDLNEAHEVVRTHDQQMPWTAERGERGITHFDR